MIRTILKLIESGSGTYAPPASKPHLRSLIHLDAHLLEDIGVSPQEVVMASPRSAARGRFAVIAGSHSARWSLSGAWDGLRTT